MESVCSSVRFLTRRPPRLLEPMTHSRFEALQRSQGVVTTPSTVGLQTHRVSQRYSCLVRGGRVLMMKRSSSIGDGDAGSGSASKSVQGGRAKRFLPRSMDQGMGCFIGRR